MTTKESWEFMNIEVLLTKVLDRLDKADFQFIRDLRSGNRMGVDIDGEEFVTVLKIFDQKRVAEFLSQHAGGPKRVLLSELNNSTIGRFLSLVSSQQLWNSFKIFQNDFYVKSNTASGYHRYHHGVQELLMDQVLRYYIYVRPEWKFAQLYGSCVTSSVVFKVRYQEALQKKIAGYYRLANQRLFADSAMTILSDIQVSRAIVEKHPQVELFADYRVTNELARYISSENFPLVVDIQKENKILQYGRDKFPMVLSMSTINRPRSIMVSVARYIKEVSPASITIVTNMNEDAISFLPSLDSNITWKISTERTVSIDRSNYQVIGNALDNLEGDVVFLFEDYRQVQAMVANNNKITSYLTYMDITAYTEFHAGKLRLMPYGENHIVELICRAPFENLPVDEQIINGHFQAVVCKEFGLFQNRKGRWVTYDRMMEEVLSDARTLSVIDDRVPQIETVFDKLFVKMTRLDKLKSLYLVLHNLKKCLMHLYKTSKQLNYLREVIVERGWRYDPANKDIPSYVEFFENEVTLDKYYRRLTQTNINVEMNTLQEVIAHQATMVVVKSWMKLVYDLWPNADDSLFGKDLSYYATERVLEGVFRDRQFGNVVAIIDDSPHSMAVPMALAKMTKGHVRIFSATEQYSRVNMAAVELFYKAPNVLYRETNVQANLWDSVKDALSSLSNQDIVYVDGRYGNKLLNMFKEHLTKSFVVFSESEFANAVSETVVEERFVQFEPRIYVRQESTTTVEPVPVIPNVEEVPVGEPPMAGGYRGAAVTTGENIRGYLNQMKRILIQSAKGTSYNVLDIGCGKGQDLNKFNDYANVRYLGVDQSNEEIAEANRRRDGAAMGVNVFNYVVTKDAFQATPDWLSVAKSFGKTGVFDVISFQLSIHYAFRGAKTVQTLIDNLASISHDGTRIIISTLDDDQIADRVTKAKETAKGSDIYFYGANDFRIEIDDYSRQQIMNKQVTIGDASYDFVAFPKDEGARKVTEYPVPRTQFVSMMTKAGYHLVEEKNSLEYEKEIQSKRKFSLTNDDRDMISLYKTYTFVKKAVTTAGPSKPVVAEPTAAIEATDKFILYAAENFQKKAPGGLAAESVKNVNDYKELKKVENWRRLLSDEGVLPADMYIQLENGEVFVSVDHAIEYFHMMGFNSDMANRLRMDIAQTDLAMGKDKKLFTEYLKEFKAYVAEQKKDKNKKKDIQTKEEQWEARRGEFVNMIYERKFGNVSLRNALLETNDAQLFENTSTRHTALETLRSKLRLAKNL